jgi:hypothetical protein
MFRDSLRFILVNAAPNDHLGVDLRSNLEQTRRSPLNGLKKGPMNAP